MGAGKSIVVFTGQPGIGVKGCLDRLCEGLGGVDVVSVDRTMEDISGRSFTKEILLEAPGYQRQLWSQAFARILGSLSKKPEGRTFLTFHAVYYHQDSREFVPPVDVEALRSLRGKARALVVLIDDIYDVYRRLLDGGHMYSYVMNREPLEAVQESVFNLISILQWRQAEVSISRLLSQVLDAPMYIVATKHPLSTVASLVTGPVEELEVFYLAHPITTVRQDAAERLQDFSGELNSFAARVIGDASRVVFLPATIDELIIRKEGDQYVPEREPRWSLPYSDADWMCPCLPKGLEKIEPLNPRRYDARSSQKVRSSISCLLKLLRDFIDVQTTWRDLSLVEQSKNGVVAYRPYFPRGLSGGVARELERNLELSRREPARRCIVVSVPEDRAKHRIQSLFFHVQTVVKDLDGATENALDETCHAWLRDNQRIATFSDDAALEREYPRIRKAIEEIVPGSYEVRKEFHLPETHLPAGQMGQQEKHRRDAHEYILRQITQDPLGKLAVSSGDYHEFASASDISADVLQKHDLRFNNQ